MWGVLLELIEVTRTTEAIHTNDTPGRILPLVLISLQGAYTRWAGPRRSGFNEEPRSPHRSDA